MKKIFISLAIVVIVVLIIVFNLKSSSSGAKELEVDVVKIGPIMSTVRAEGELRAKNQVEIGADVMGRIVKLPVHEGDHVEIGDTLCVIDPSTYIARAEQVRSRLLADLSRLKKARTDLDRIKELHEQKLVSDASYEESLANFESLKAQTSADSFSLKEALESLKKTVITSPIKGEVVAVYKEEGEMAIVGTVNTPGSVIMVVADRSTMQVSALVDETEVVHIRKKQKAKVSIDAFPDSTFMGSVVRIGGVPEKTLVTSQTEGVSYPVEIELKGSGRLLSGMSAVADIIVAEKDSALLLPFPAVGSREVEGKRRDVVFVIKDGIAHLTPVKLGISSERFIEALDGVKEGDTVAIGPFKVLQKLKDKEKVKIKGAIGKAMGKKRKRSANIGKKSS